MQARDTYLYFLGLWSTQFGFEHVCVCVCSCVCVHDINRSGLNLMINNPPRKQKCGCRSGPWSAGQEGKRETKRSRPGIQIAKTNAKNNSPRKRSQKYTKLHITAQPGPVKLISQCYSNGSALWGISVCVVITFSRLGINQVSMVANPSCGQLTGKTEFFMSPFAPQSLVTRLRFKRQEAYIYQICT